jgi:hypothetical protein
MSAKILTLIFDFYDQKRFGAPRIMAVVLADEADDRGGGIFQSVKDLSLKSEQKERGVRAQLRRLQESGLLECMQSSSGGVGNYNEYRLNLGLLVAEITRHQEQGKPCTRDRVTDPETLHQEQGFDAHHIRSTKELFIEDASSCRVSEGAEDRRLAEWMFEQLRKFHPKHGAPSWQTWCRDIRLMRDREKRTRREIAELFTWANADPFWQANILCPGTLRRQWDKLEIQRMRKGGNGRGGQAAPVAIDKSCSNKVNGERCGKPGAFSVSAHPDAPWVCRECNVEREQRRAGGQA